MLGHRTVPRSSTYSCRAGGRYGQRVAVVEPGVAVPVADLVVAERHPSPVIGPRRNQNRGLVPRLVGSRAVPFPPRPGV